MKCLSFDKTDIADNKNDDPQRMERIFNSKLKIMFPNQMYTHSFIYSKANLYSELEKKIGLTTRNTWSKSWFFHFLSKLPWNVPQLPPASGTSSVKWGFWSILCLPPSWFWEDNVPESTWCTFKHFILPRNLNHLVSNMSNGSTPIFQSSTISHINWL